MELLRRLTLLQQQQELINAFPVVDPVAPKASRLTTKVPLHQQMLPAPPAKKHTADAATDAREILEHTAALRKANMVLQCCPILQIDDGVWTPPDEDPALYYLVVKNLRNPGPETRELLELLIHRTANFASLEFVQVLERSYSAFIGFRTIRTILAVAKTLPNKIAQRNIMVCLARSKYFPAPEDMITLFRQCTEERPMPFANAIVEDL